jgi:hypothetical protein
MSRATNRVTLLTVALVASVFLTSAGAAVVYVPDDYTSVQEAIDAAVDGDTVMVGPGTYRENIQIKDKKLTLVSTQGPETTIIDGGGMGSVVSLERGGSGTLLEGFTLTNGAAARGGGIYIYWSSLVVRNCIIADNTATSHGGGVSVQTYAGFTAYDSVIRDNHAENGGGVAVQTGGLFIHRTKILNNRADNFGGAFLSTGWVSNPNLHDSVIAGNSARYGGAFYSSGYATDARATNSVIERNVAELGAPFYTGSGGGFYSRNSTVANNTATVEGGGGYAEAGTGYIGAVNSVIYHNSGPPVLLMDPEDAFITYSDIEGGYPGEGYIDSDPSFVDLSSGDYRLGGGSACIDSGTSTEYGLPDHDIEGNPRPQGDGYDMGAYEAPPCQEVPAFEILAFGPDSIWPPNGATVDISVAGRIVLPAACTLVSASYSLLDEYAEHSASGLLEVEADGTFFLSIPVTASREGQDRDGRSFTLTLDALDEAGASGTAPLVSTVPHDQGH